MAVKNYAIAVRDSNSAPPGLPRTGLTPTWLFLVKTSDYVTAAPQPAIAEILPIAAAPAAPAPTTGTTGGTVAAGAYPITVAYTDGQGGGETVASAAGTVTTTGTTSTMTIPSPPAAANATHWYAYVPQAGGTAASGTRQQPAGSPTPIGTALVLTANPTATGVTSPTTNTTGRGQYRFAYDAAANGEAVGQIDAGATLTNPGDRYIDVMLTV